MQNIRYNSSHLVSTKIEHVQVQQKERTEKVLEHRLIYPEFAAPRLYSGLMHHSTKQLALCKFSRRRCRRQGLFEAKSKQEAKVQHYNFNEYERNARKYYTKTVKVLFIVNPEFKLKGVVQREQLGFSENTLSVTEII